MTLIKQKPLAIPHRQLLFSSAILLGAAMVRLWQLEQMPVGFHIDEAFHLLNAQKIAAGQAFPVYLTGNYGNEPLFAYTAALMLKLVGPVSWAGRLASAWAGVLGVAFTIRAGREMFPGTTIGLAAGFVLATLYPHLHFSRYGSQPILAPLAAAGTLAAVWCGVRLRSSRAYALAGLCLGLGLIAYLAFRLFPLTLLVAGPALLIARKGERRSIFTGGLLAVGVALVVYAPLGLFFSQHPGWFFNRFTLTTGATLGSAARGQILWTNTLKTLGGLFLRGDADGRYNLPGRPMLDAIQFAFFLGGLAVCLRHWRRAESWALLTWLIVGLLPSAITEGAPQFGRTTMVTPALALIAALGLVAAWRFARWPAARLTLMGALSLSTWFTLRDYFSQYALAPETFAVMNGDELALARELQHAPAGAQLYATPLQRDYYLDYTILGGRLSPDEFGIFDRGYWSLEYLLGQDAYARFGAFNGHECLVLPEQTTAPTIYAVMPERDTHTLPLLESIFPGGTRATSAEYANYLHLETYTIPANRTAQIAPTTRGDAIFGGMAELVGVTLDTPTLKPGEVLAFSIVWKVLARAESPYKTFVHLIGVPKADGSPIYAQRDAEPCLNSYPTWQWTPGELVIDRYSIPLPSDMPAGNYTLQAGWYEARGDGARLPATDSRGQPLGDSAPLVRVEIVQP